MTYRLKKGQENFEVVDGAFAGKKFVRGREYDVVPPEEMRRFEKTKAAPAGGKAKKPEHAPTTAGTPDLTEV